MNFRRYGIQKGKESDKNQKNIHRLDFNAVWIVPSSR